MQQEPVYPFKQKHRELMVFQPYIYFTIDLQPQAKKNNFEMHNNEPHSRYLLLQAIVRTNS
jgi:hypothetical protein